MLNCLLIDPTVSTSAPRQKMYIEGTDLLLLLDLAMRTLPFVSGTTGGDGSYQFPWQLNGDALGWFSLSQHLTHWDGVERYFIISGRYVKKLKNFYMVDAGGLDEEQGTAWNKLNDRQNFERGAPSYRNLAKRMDAGRLASTKNLSEEVWSQHKAAKLRKVLQADPQLALNYQSKGNWTSGQVLPVLAATLFLAEPARNVRTFFTNKVLLDFMEAQITYGGRKEGSAPKQYTWNKALLGDPNDQIRGGKSSAANAGSGKAGYNIAPTDAPTFDHKNKPTGSYSQGKELTLLCRALSGGSMTGVTMSAEIARTHTRLVVRGDCPVNSSGSMNTPLETLGYLKYLMQFCVRNWSL